MEKQIHRLVPPQYAEKIHRRTIKTSVARQGKNGFQLLSAANRFSSGFSAAAEASPMVADGTDASCAEISRPDSSAT
jgi:hypothetical protein